MKIPLLPIGVLVLVSLSSLLGGCAGMTQISAMHDPIYRAEPHSSTITATATNKDDKIAEIRIDVIDGDMTACTENGGFPSVIPCRRDATFQARICQFPDRPVTATCTWTRSLGDRRLVTYDATARSGTGKTATTATISYAGGASITEVTLPFLNIRVSWDVARPVYWHTSPPSANDTRDRIDVGFFPDPDISTYRSFTDDLQPLVLGAFFDQTTNFAKLYTFWRGNFNIWAGPTGADGGAATSGICFRNFNGLAGNVSGAMIGSVIVHDANFRDCSVIAAGGSGTVHTGAPNPSQRFMHESGHFLHALGDEYCCNGGYFSSATPRNIDTSKTACESTATSISLATSLCQQIGTNAAWRIDDGSDEIMEDGGNVNADWRDAAARVLGNRMNSCVSGNCY